MIRVIYSNHLERLVDALVELIRQEKKRTHQTAFEQVRVVVPNWNLETFLKLQIARRSGLAAALRFERLESFMASIIPDEAAVELLGVESIQSLVLEALARPELLERDDLEPVRAFLAAAGDEAGASARRRFQLAGRVAELFREYRYARPDMLQAWRAGERFVEAGAFAQAESWQRALWSTIFGPAGQLEQIAQARGVTYLHVAQLFEHFDRDALEIPPVVHLFGLSYVANIYERVFWDLGEASEVCLYAMNPCRELWEDVVGDPVEEEQILSSRAITGGRLDFDGDSGFWEPEKHPPALRLWGRAGRDHVRMLNRLSAYNFEERWVESKPRSTLQHLQADILALEPEREEPIDGLEDDSIQVLACPSVAREVEVISDEIWALVRGERQTWVDSPVAFNDIAVIVNHDQREIYQTRLQATFRSAHQIPFNIIDIDATHHNKLVEALELLYALPLGRFRRRELLRLMIHPNLFGAFEGADRDAWVAWCDALGIVHGADHDAHRDTYIEEDLYNWDQGLRRLALGAAMVGESSGVEGLYEAGEFAYLPYEVERDQVEQAGQFIAAARALIRDARRCRAGERPLSAWCDLMGEMLDAYMVPTEGEDEYELVRARGLLRDVAELDLTGRPVPYRTAYEFVRQKLRGLDVQRGQYLTEGVVISSFLPMRPIPFKVVFVTGMGEGKFPTADTRDPLDLRMARWREGDVYKRDQDKYMFLETLISTRDRFYMSYVSRDGRTGDVLEPASTVRQMQAILEQGYLGRDGVAKQTIAHPLRRFDERYFDPEANLPTLVYPEARREAGIRQLKLSLEAHCREYGLAFPEPDRLREALPEHVWGDVSRRLSAYRVPTSEAQSHEQRPWSVSIAQLRRFLQTPLQTAASAVLGLRRAEQDDLLAVDDEAFQSEFFEAHHLLEQVFEGVERGGELEPTYDAHARRHVLGGRLPGGLFGACERRAHLETLAAWLHNRALLGIGGVRPLGRYRFGRAHGHVAAGQVLEALKVRAVGASGPVDVEVYGATNLIDPNPEGAPASMRLGYSTRFGLRDALHGFFDYLALCAAGVVDGGEGFVASTNPRLMLDPGRRGKRYSPATYHVRLGPLTRARALTYLQELARELIERPHDYLLPVEAVIEWFEADRDRPLADFVVTHRDSAYRPPATQHGPIHDWRAYGPPHDAEEMAMRRFGLFFELLEAGGRDDG